MILPINPQTEEKHKIKIMGGRAKGLEGQERVGLLTFRKETIPMQYQDFEEMLYGTNYNVHSTK